MANDLVILENQLRPLAPSFAEVLGHTMQPERLIRTLIVSAERNPSLLSCDRQSLLNAAMTFAVLGLEVDGVTGQGYVVPFKDRRAGKTIAQPIIGYKGMNTLGARSGFTITGAVVREGDEFDYDDGSKPFIKHKRKLGGEPNRKIIAAWAAARSIERPPIFKILSIDELLAVKAKSPRGNEPPWADQTIGFPAMCEKTVKRRLARDMPLNTFQLAARMEEAFEEQGQTSWIGADKTLLISGEVIQAEQPTAAEILGSTSGDADDAAPASQSPHPNPPEAGAADLSEDILFEIDDRLAAAAKNGWDALTKAWNALTADQQNALRPNLNAMHKPAARAADKAKAGTP